MYFVSQSGRIGVRDATRRMSVVTGCAVQCAALLSLLPPGPGILLLSTGLLAYDMAGGTPKKIRELRQKIAQYEEKTAQKNPTNRARKRAAVKVASGDGISTEKATKRAKTLKAAYSESNDTVTMDEEDVVEVSKAVVTLVP